MVLSPLERLEEPTPLRRLQCQVTQRLPQVRLPELVLGIEARTDFAPEFTHVSESRSRSADLPVSLCPVLLAEACNLPLNTFVQEGVPVLQRERLLWVQQNYMRPETISAANARLVEFHQHIPLSQVWGWLEATPQVAHQTALSLEELVRLFAEQWVEGYECRYAEVQARQAAGRLPGPGEWKGKQTAHCVLL